MSAPSSLLRSAPHNVPKLPLPSLTPSYCMRQPPQSSVTRTSRSLATVNPGQKSIPDVWFTGSTPRSDISNLSSNDSRKPPDERTVKLGKSKSASHSTSTPTDEQNSTENSTRTTPNAPSIAPSTRNHLSANKPSPLPLNPPAPPCRHWPRSLLRRSLDLAHSMGSRAPGRQRQA
jgi:hypothetical protein